MTISKKFILHILFMAMYLNVFSQKNEKQYGCSSDSTNIHTFFEYISNGGGNLQSQGIEQDFINKIGKNREDCICKLLMYAKIFDGLLQKGLKIKQYAGPNYQYNDNSRQQSEEEIIQRKEERRMEDERGKQSRIYDYFRSFKDEDYYDNIFYIYQNNPNWSLEKDVDKIIASGLYTQPKTLKYMLMVTEKELNEKARKEATEYENNNKH